MVLGDLMLILKEFTHLRLLYQSLSHIATLPFQFAQLRFECIELHHAKKAQATTTRPSSTRTRTKGALVEFKNYPARNR